MDRTITGFHQDVAGDWVAELSCGHDQHVRHRPPFQERPWVVTAEGRHGRLGTSLPCPLCDRSELPESACPVRSSPVWDERTMPAGLRRAHQLAPGTWGVLRVHDGALRFSTGHVPSTGMELRSGSPPLVIPPQALHQVSPSGPVRFSIEFFTVDRGLHGGSRIGNVGDGHDR